MEKLYTIRDACKILQLNPNTLRNWDRKGKIKCIRLSNNFRRVPESEINRILGIKNNRMSHKGSDLHNNLLFCKTLRPEIAQVEKYTGGS